MAVKPTRKSKARTIIIDERNAPDVMRWVNSQYHLIAKQRGYPAAPKPTNILLDAVRQAISTKKGE